MKSPFNFLRISFQSRSRAILSLAAAESILLSVFHHRLNFWGLPWDKQALLIVVVAPACSLLISLLLAPIWEDCQKIQSSRLILFLIPALGIAAIITWRLFAVPEVQHQLDIIPGGSRATQVIQLQEIRGAYGSVVPLSNFTGSHGWTLHDGLLIADGSAAQPIHYAFRGPIGQQIRVTFQSSATGGNVAVVLDGRRLDLDLASADGNQKRARMDTQFRWGFLNFLIIPLIVITDILAFIFLLTMIWLVQETIQIRPADSEQGRTDPFLSHRNSLLILCGLALILHILNFLAVPLAVIKDSPSYLQGAVYWIRYHSLDGVSSYRGPGTTFLFTPFMAPFGRNPLALKVLLHLMAVACVPLSYRLGWQLGRRRWFAFMAGLVAALIPDLFYYSNFVMSEIPHFFFGLLFSTLLLSALETMAAGWLVAALLVGSFSVLVRSESAAPLAIGIVFLLLKVVWDWKTQRSSGSLPAGVRRAGRSAFWRLGLAVLIAGIPLLAWSQHNERVYGFFGISDYGGEILYDGWIYFGLNSNIPITDPNSPAVKAIDAVYPPGLSNTSDVPSGWTIYYLLLQHGYTSEQAFSILGRASMDSIRNDMPLSLKLLAIKIQKGLEPDGPSPATFLLPGEQAGFEILNSDYFDPEPQFFPAIINLQRFVDSLVNKVYPLFYTVWFWLGLGLSFICFYRTPFFQWAPLAAIVVTSVFLPTFMGMSMWRYVLSGTIMMQLFILGGIQSLAEFLPYYLGKRRVMSS